MLVIKTNFNSNKINRADIISMFNNFEPLMNIGEAAEQLKKWGLDVEMIKDVNNGVIWLIGGKPPRQNDSWEQWFFMVTPQDPSDSRCAAQTYNDCDPIMFHTVEDAYKHVRNTL